MRFLFDWQHVGPVARLSGLVTVRRGEQVVWGDADGRFGSQTREAVRRGVDLVVVAGGDGTVRVVCSGLADTGIPLGIIPAGTGNLLARNLDLTLDNVEESVRNAFSGADRKIDLGVAVSQALQGETQGGDVGAAAVHDASGARTATTSRVHLNSSIKRLERCLRHMADQ